MMYRRLTVVMCVATASCQVDMRWRVDDGATYAQEKPVGNDDAAADGPYLAGGSIRMAFRRPWTRQISGWRVAARGAGRLVSQQSGNGWLYATLMFPEAGLATIELIRPSGAVADSRTVDVLAPTTATIRSWNDARTDRDEPLKGDIHIAKEASVGFQVGWLASGERLVGQGVLTPHSPDPSVRATLAEAVTQGMGQDTFNLYVGRDAPDHVVVQLSAGDLLIRSLDVHTYDPAQIDAISLVARSERHHDEDESDSRTGWLVAETFVTDNRVFGVPVYWIEDGMTRGKGTFAEVIEPAYPGERHEIRVCLNLASEQDSGAVDTDDITQVPLCTTRMIDGSLGNIGNDAQGAFCGCQQSSGQGLLGVVGLLGLVAIRRRRT